MRIVGVARTHIQTQLGLIRIKQHRNETRSLHSLPNSFFNKVDSCTDCTYDFVFLKQKSEPNLLPNILFNTGSV
jgi:hypothetical protein